MHEVYTTEGPPSRTDRAGWSKRSYWMRPCLPISPTAMYSGNEHVGAREQLHELGVRRRVVVGADEDFDAAVFQVLYDRLVRGAHNDGDALEEGVSTLRREDKSIAYVVARAQEPIHNTEASDSSTACNDHTRLVFTRHAEGRDLLSELSTVCDWREYSPVLIYLGHGCGDPQTGMAST